MSNNSILVVTSEDVCSTLHSLVIAPDTQHEPHPARVGPQIPTIMYNTLKVLNGQTIRKASNVIKSNFINSLDSGNASTLPLALTLIKVSQIKDTYSSEIRILLIDAELRLTF